MKILAYDTSSDLLTIALFENERKIAEWEAHSFARHSSTLVPSIDKLLKERRISLSDIEVLAVGLGPGSFTGLRVGVASAKVFAYIQKMKIVGVPSLEAMAWEAPSFDGEICVILDAKKEKLYAGIYEIKNNALKVVQKPKIAGIEMLLKNIKRPRLFLGNGVGVHRQKLLSVKFCQIAENAEQIYPRASNIVKQALPLIQKKKFSDPFRMEPLYLHPKDCNVMKK